MNSINCVSIANTYEVIGCLVFLLSVGTSRISKADEPDLSQHMSNKTWLDASGRFSIVARMKSQTTYSVVLQTTTGKIVTVPKAKLSSADQTWLARQDGKAASNFDTGKKTPRKKEVTKPQEIELPSNTTNKSEEGTLSREIQLEQILINAIAVSNRSGKRVHVVSATRSEIRVRLTVNDNSLTSLIKAEAKKDIRDLLKAMHQSSISYETIYFELTFPLINKLGHSEEAKVAESQYSKSVVDRINWPRFIIDDVFDIADRQWIHPSF